MTPVEILEKAKEKISKKKNWTTRYYARTIDFFPRQPDDEFASCWCAIGAILAVSDKNDNARNIAFDYLSLNVVELWYNNSISDYNDTHTHKEVMELFDKAIALAKEEEKVK